jgi:hypothetical protein
VARKIRSPIVSFRMFFKVTNMVVIAIIKWINIDNNTSFGRQMIGFYNKEKLWIRRHIEFELVVEQIIEAKLQEGDMERICSRQVVESLKLELDQQSLQTERTTTFLKMFYYNDAQLFFYVSCWNIEKA